MKKVKFKSRDYDGIVPAYVLGDASGTLLLIPPPDKDYCFCLTFGIEGKDGIFCEDKQLSYLNATTAELKRLRDKLTKIIELQEKK